MDICEYGGNCRKLCNRRKCMVCKGKSFETHERSKFWDYSKNFEAHGRLIPRNVFKGTAKPYWFFCQICGHQYEQIIRNITFGGNGCMFCTSQKLCSKSDCNFCLGNSFSSRYESKFWDYDKNNLLKGGKTPRDVFIGTKDKYWFLCHDCGHSYKQSINKKTSSNHGCPFCKYQDLCDNPKCEFCKKKSFASNKNSSNWDYNSNKGTTPRDFCLNSDHKASFHCIICKKSFSRSIKKITTRGCKCRDCKYNTESLLKDFLLEVFPDIEREKSFIWCRSFRDKPYYFDFYEESLKIIVELDGDQHFKQVWNWQNPEERRLVDVYKMKLAVDNGITVIRILQEDVYNNRIDWKTILLNAIKEYSRSQIIYLTNTDIYKDHIKLYEENTIEELAEKIRNFNLNKAESLGKLSVEETLLDSNLYINDNVKRIIVKIKRKKLQN